MRRALPIFSVLVVLAVPTVAHAECPPGSWFCADVAVPGPNGADAAKPAEAPKAAAPAPAGTGTTVIVNNAGPKAAPKEEAEEEAPPPKPKKRRPPPPPVYTYQPPPPAPPIAASRPHELWGLNTHIEGAMIGTQKGSSNNDSGMGGIGFALRSRPLRHLAFDFGLDFIGGRDYLGQRRSEVPFTINALVFLNPKSAVEAYFLAGIGWSSAHVDLAQGGTAHYDYFGGQIGFGLEFRITHRVSINTDIIGFVRGRTDSGANTQPEFVDPATGRTTNTSGGGLVRGGLTFYWPLAL